MRHSIIPVDVIAFDRVRRVKLLVVMWLGKPWLVSCLNFVLIHSFWFTHSNWVDFVPASCKRGLTLLVDSLEAVTDLISDVADNVNKLTTAHADRGRPTPKDDEKFRNGLVCDFVF